MAPSTSSKKDLGVVTPSVTAKRVQSSFFLPSRFLLLRMRCPFSCLGLLGVPVFLVFILNLILFYLFLFIFNHSHTTITTCLSLLASHR